LRLATTIGNSCQKKWMDFFVEKNTDVYV